MFKDICSKSTLKLLILQILIVIPAYFKSDVCHLGRSNSLFKLYGWAELLSSQLLLKITSCLLSQCDTFVALSQHIECVPERKEIAEG